MFFKKIIQSPCCLFLVAISLRFSQRVFRWCKGTKNKPILQVFSLYISKFFSNVKIASMVDRRVDGSDMGEMTGEVKGEMKMARCLYLKASAPSDGRDGHDFVNTPSLSVNNPWLLGNNARLIDNQFPYWELFIPTLGTIYSQPGNKTFPPWE